MLRNPKKNWLITIICCLIAMGLAWGASRLMVHQAAEADAAISAPEANAEIVEDAGRAVEQSADDAAAALSDSGVNDSKAAATEIEGLDEVDPEYEPAFVMPEGAEYEPNVVLVTVADGVTAE